VQFTVTILTPDADIIDNIMSEMTVVMNRALTSASIVIRRKLLDKIRELILVAPETNDLINGDLGKELGLIDASAFIETMIQAIQNSVSFTTERVGYIGTRFVSGGYEIGILKGDYSDILSLSGASYNTDNGVNIPWLSWLLLAGDSPVVYGWRIDFNPKNASASRTGVIMVRDPGGSWAVPAQYSGVQDDNFLTRALSSIVNDIDIIIRDEVERAI
jgi:hypothetical protein